MKISVLIIDDESPARDLIRHYLQNYPDVEIVGEASNGFEAIILIKEFNPQLIFLDIQMPKLTGFEMLELMDRLPEIIFTTAYDQYALRAFDSNAVDYLLKPFSKQRFDIALQKAINKIQRGDTESDNIQSLQKEINSHPEILTRIAVKDRQHIHVIQIDNIDYFESRGNYVVIHCGKQVFLKEKTMKYLENSLPPGQFIRIHRSYIVNVHEVLKIELYEKDNFRVHLKSGDVLKASNSGYQTLKKAVIL